jgi:hypothetical protein
MIHRKLIVASLALCSVLTATLQAQQVEEFVQDGVRFQRIRQVTQKPISETRYESRQYTTYHPRYTTDYHDSVRTYQVPVTEQQWVPGYQRTLNIFAPPVLSYRLVPVTRWETRTETVRVPVTRQDYVAQQRVEQVPITTQRLVQDTHESVIAIGPSGTGAPLVANSNSAAGGTRLDNSQSSSSNNDAVWNGAK